MMTKRLLVNLRADPEAVARILPHGFRPLLAGDAAIVGCCAIELHAMRPAALRRVVPFGVRTVNVAHRIAVEHQGAQGMWIPRRVSSSSLTRIVGGRVFPGIHGRGRIDFHDSQSVQLRVTGTNGYDLHVRTAPTVHWPSDSAFEALSDAVSFYRGASWGWSPAYRRQRLDVVQLESSDWTVDPQRIEDIESAYWARVLPAGSYEPDVALVVRNLDHTWRSLGQEHFQPTAVIR